jgi:hypothetical protein
MVSSPNYLQLPPESANGPVRLLDLALPVVAQVAFYSGARGVLMVL